MKKLFVLLISYSIVDFYCARRWAFSGKFHAGAQSISTTHPGTDNEHHIADRQYLHLFITGSRYYPCAYADTF
jgi:hypothetical protein